ncbi:MAG: methyltransferase domain-containing protein [Luteitalea sp.]|nr:methyltransferase domain-containing protein [Luteitalea sp.]
MTTRLVLSMFLAGLTFVQVSVASGPQLSSRPAESWIARLERPERVSGLKIPEVVEKLGLTPGDVVADLGAGAGVFSWPLARAVAPGTLYAVEIDKGFIEHLTKRANEQQITNVRPVLGQYEDPQLPEKVDLAFFHDVLHHVEKRPEYLQSVASYLKPSGRIAVIELDATDPNSSHSDEPELQVMKEDLDTWMTATGLRKVDEIDMFEGKWFVIYEKGPATQ